MKPLAPCLLLALALLPATALAGYGSGSALEADAPVALEGRIDALVAKGLVSFVSTEGADNLLLSLTAPEMEIRYVVVPQACPPASVPACSPDFVTGARPAEEAFELRDATLTVVRPLGAFKVVAANDPEAYAGTASFGTPGPLVTTTSAGTTFTTDPAERHLSPFQEGWDDQGPASASTRDVYSAGAHQGEVVAEGGGTLRGAGGFHVLLQGATVRVKGTQDGKAFEREFDTASPASQADAVKYLTVQTPLGILSANSKAPLLAHGVTVADATGGATFAAARGKVDEDGASRTYDGEDATLSGPLSLTLTKVVPGDPPRLAFGLSSTLRIAQGLPPPEDEEQSDTASLVAAGVAGASGAGLLAAAAYFWPRLKFASTLLFLPLYSRIERTAVLEHEKRDEIYGLIRATPGIHAHEIGEKAQIGWGTTVYHLKLLEQHSLIVSQKSGRYKRFFVNTGEFTKKKDVYGALRNETAKSVAQFIVDHPGVTQKELCAALGIQPSLASWHVEKLEGVELVKRVKDGRMVRYFAGPAWSALNVRIDPRGGGEGVAET